VRSQAEWCLLGCDTTQFGRLLPAFQRKQQVSPNCWQQTTRLYEVRLQNMVINNIKVCLATNIWKTVLIDTISAYQWLNFSFAFQATESLTYSMDCWAYTCNRKCSSHFLCTCAQQQIKLCSYILSSWHIFPVLGLMWHKASFCWLGNDVHRG
jgi:hypothetical protein